MATIVKQNKRHATNISICYYFAFETTTTAILPPFVCLFWALVFLFPSTYVAPTFTIIQPCKKKPHVVYYCYYASTFSFFCIFLSFYIFKYVATRFQSLLFVLRLAA